MKSKVICQLVPKLKSEKSKRSESIPCSFHCLILTTKRIISMFYFLLSHVNMRVFLSLLFYTIQCPLFLIFLFWGMEVLILLTNLCMNYYGLDIWILKHVPVFFPILLVLLTLQNNRGQNLKLERMKEW